MKKSKSDSGQSLFERFKNVSQGVDVSGLTAGDIAALNEVGIDASKLKEATPRGRPPKVTPEQRLAIIKLRELNYSIQSIADAIGISRNTVWVVIDQHKNNKNLKKENDNSNSAGQ